MSKRKSRPTCWEEAVAEAQKILERCLKLKEELNSAASELEGPLTTLNELKEEYEEWQGNLPENMQSGELASKLEAVTSIDIPSSAEADNIEEIEEAINECDGVDLPRGFGRD